MSRRLETLECGPLKVNDAVGNPIDIGAVIVWRVQDAAKAILEVESYALYVKAQSETALRRMASAHPYDQVEVLEAEKLDKEPGASAKDPALPTVTLRDGGDAVARASFRNFAREWSRSASPWMKPASHTLLIRPRLPGSC